MIYSIIFVFVNILDNPKKKDKFIQIRIEQINNGHCCKTLEKHFQGKNSRLTTCLAEILWKVGTLLARERVDHLQALKRHSFSCMACQRNGNFTWNNIGGLNGLWSGLWSAPYNARFVYLLNGRSNPHRCTWRTLIIIAPLFCHFRQKLRNAFLPLKPSSSLLVTCWPVFSTRKMHIFWPLP